MATALKPNRIEGWMGAKGRRWLRKQARAHTAIVEVGCWKGLSTEILAKGTKGRVWAVDTWAGTPDDPGQHELYAPLMPKGPDSVFRAFKRNVRGYIKMGRVIVCRGESIEMANRFAHEGRRFDFVFIDADHSYESVVADILAWRSLLSPGGLLSGHDYGKESWPGVTQAVDELVPGAKIGPASIWSARV